VKAAPKPVRWAVVSDFDGTVTTFDVGDAVCMRFRAATKEEVEASYDPSVSVPRWMQRYFGRLSASPSEIEKFVRKAVSPRKGLSGFASFCRKGKIPFEIASGGVDLYIRPLLSKWKLEDVKVFCGKHRHAGSGYRLSYPMLRGRSLEKFKASRVRAFQKAGYKVVFCGDGPSDFPASRVADAVFARHRLLVSCRRHGVKARPLVSFDAITSFIRKGY